MAMTNAGFDGTVTEGDFARMADIGMTEGVESSASWAVTQGTGRQVSVAAQDGWAFAKGVISKDTAANTASLGTPTNGQWYLIVRRIDWAADTVVVAAIAHSTTTTTIPTVAPSTFPAYNDNPGVIYDQHLSWAWVRSTDTTMVLFDLRTQPLGTRLALIPANVADVAALGSASNEGQIKHVDDMGANFQAQDGVWVQITDAVFASTSARNTAYAKAGAAYLVARAHAWDTSTGLLSIYSGSVWEPASPKVIAGAGKTGTMPATALPIIQAARVSTTTSGASLVTVTFPTAFPNGVTAVTLTTGSGSANPTILNSDTLTATGFTAVIPATPSTAVAFYYIAIGW